MTEHQVGRTVMLHFAYHIEYIHFGGGDLDSMLLLYHMSSVKKQIESSAMQDRRHKAEYQVVLMFHYVLINIMHE